MFNLGLFFTSTSIFKWYFADNTHNNPWIVKEDGYADVL
jgi:hypothetical protein